MTDFKIPTREENARFIVRIWRICAIAAIGVFLVTGGIMLALFLSGYDSKKIVEVTTSVFQILVLAYGLGFFVPAFITSLSKMSIATDMSRKGLEIGEKTAVHLDKLQGDLTPVIGDLKSAVSDAREIVKELREKELQKISEVFSNGTFEKVLKALEAVPEKLDEIARKTEKDAVGKMIDKI